LIWAWPSHKHRIAEVSELLNRLGDVGQGAMATALGWCSEECCGKPLPRKFFDGRDVDASVVQLLFERGHVLRDEAAIHADRVASDDWALSGGHKLCDVLDDLLFGVLHRYTVCDARKQPRGLVHA